MLNHVEEHSGISFEMHENNEVVKSEILNEFVDFLVEDCHDHSSQEYFEKQLDNLQRELLFEQLSHVKQMAEFFEGCHVFYDPVEEYMETLGSVNG